MKISLVITTMNRPELTLESFSKVYDHPLIDEIVIVDDASDQMIYLDLAIKINTLNLICGGDRFKIFRNRENLGMSRNKREAVSHAKNEWVIIFDSDNILYPEYLDNIPATLNPEVIYMPTFAEPKFDYREYGSLVIDRINFKEYVGKKMFRCAMNTCNYVVNREKYLQVYEHNETVKESDTIWFNYLWFRAGYSFYFVPGMRYYHRLHEGSGWLKNKHENRQKAVEIQIKIKQL